MARGKPVAAWGRVFQAKRTACVASRSVGEPGMFEGRKEANGAGIEGASWAY